MRGSAAIANIFAGDNGSNPPSVQINSGVVGVALSNQAVIGPGFDTTITETAAVLNTLSAIVNQGSNGQMTIAQTGGVGVLNTFSATRQFTGTTLDDFTTYSFTLNRTAGSTLSVLAGTSVLITVNGAPIALSGSGAGLLGAVDALSLFGGTTTASFQFTTGDVNNTAPVTINVSGGLAAAALSSSFTFAGGSLIAVPEPCSAVFVGCGLLGLAVARRRSR